MHFRDVVSSKIKSIGYYPSKKILEIVFISSGTYQYVGVSAKTHKAFLEAKSRGCFFDDVIKDKYLCRKIG